MKALTYFAVLVFMAVCTFAMMTFLPSCTMSISTVSTHGEADDVVDSSPATETKADATIPLSIPPI